MKYYEMQHCGGLDEALKTKKPITETEFNKRLKDYKYYCYDQRIECFRFILKDIPNNYKKQTTWLLMETEPILPYPVSHSDHHPTDQSEDGNEAER